MTALLYTVAFFDLPLAQAERVQAFRAAHDPQFPVIGPHFTLLFGARGLPTAAYLDHVAAVARESPPIDFVCRQATLGADVQGDRTHVFLVPDEGQGALRLLHDRLYQGLLRPFLRWQTPFVPHITIGSTQDVGRARRLCDDFNVAGLQVAGRITGLTPGVLRQGVFQPWATCPLAA